MVLIFRLAKLKRNRDVNLLEKLSGKKRQNQKAANISIHQPNKLSDIRQ